MLGGIKTTLLLVDRDTEMAEELEGKEEDSHVDHTPAKDDEDADDLAGEEVTATSVEETPERSAAISLVDVVHLGEEANPDETSSSTNHMHGGSRERVINLELEPEAAGKLKPENSPDAVADGSPRLEDMGTSCDSNEADEDTVADANDIPRLLEKEANDKRGEATSSSRESGGDGSAGRDDATNSGVNSEVRAGVESVPAKPEKDRSEDDEDGGVARKVNWLA